MMSQSKTDNTEPVAEFIALNSPDERLRLVCKWTLRCYEQGRTVAIRIGDEPDAQQLDKLLWTFADQAFVPHLLARKSTEPVLEPVLIYLPGEAVGAADVLFEAASGPPFDEFERFTYIYDFAEVYDEELRHISRERYSAYKEAGYRMRYVERE